MIAALFVRDDGPYVGREDVDPWHLPRDAREYAGPHPVVAHPPCQRWGNFALRWHGAYGNDGGCFEAALASVRRWGGVLEHPSGSRAFKRFGLPKPGETDPWGQTIEILQSVFGHGAPKKTWLYLVNCEPLPMPVGVRGGWTDVEHQSRKQRELTPPLLADWLIAVASKPASQAQGRLW